MATADLDADKDLHVVDRQDIESVLSEQKLTLSGLVDAEYADRLGHRISKDRDQLFSFLDTPGVPPDNNRGERQIRPAVIIRKNSLCSRSEQPRRRS